jgi:hypothetical protein
MSRSIEDWEWKPSGVIREPTTAVAHLTGRVEKADGSFSLLLEARDGVWDMRPSRRIAASFGEALNGLNLIANEDIAGDFFNVCANIIWRLSSLKEE